MADRHKKPLHRKLGLLAIAAVAQAKSVHAALIAENLIDFLKPANVDFALIYTGCELIDHDGLGPKAVAPVNHGDFTSDVGKIQRLLDRRISTSDDGHFLTAVEEAITGGTCAHPPTHVRLLGG